MAIERLRVKKREHPYVILDKTALEDPLLSFRAKGIHAYLMSRPDTWVIRYTHLETVSRDGRDAVRSAMKELEKAGYLKKFMHRDERGRAASHETVFYEIPGLFHPDDGKPSYGEDPPLTGVSLVTEADQPADSPRVDFPPDGKPPAGKASPSKYRSSNSRRVVSIESISPLSPPKTGGQSRDREKSLEAEAEPDPSLVAAFGGKEQKAGRCVGYPRRGEPRWCEFHRRSHLVEGK